MMHETSPLRDNGSTICTLRTTLQPSNVHTHFQMLHILLIFPEMKIPYIYNMLGAFHHQCWLMLFALTYFWLPWGVTSYLIQDSGGAQLENKWCLPIECAPWWGHFQRILVLFGAYWYILSFNLFVAFALRWNPFVSDMLHCLPGRHTQTTP